MKLKNQFALTWTVANPTAAAAAGGGWRQLQLATVLVAHPSHYRRGQLSAITLPFEPLAIHAARMLDAETLWILFAVSFSKNLSSSSSSDLALRKRATYVPASNLLRRGVHSENKLLFCLGIF